jgi:uncharacterized SAM-binding protein YcdF (DUF218 family)
LRRAIALLAAAFAVLAGLAFVDPPHGSASRPLHADAAIVPSGDVDYLRIKSAAGLFQAGEVSWLLLTGKGAGGDSALVLRDVAIRFHVPEDRILLEQESTSTRENFSLATPIVRTRQWKRVALVTSRSHMGRAERVAHRVLPEVLWLPVPVPDAGPPRRIVRTRFQEWVKLAWYAAHGWL